MALPYVGEHQETIENSPEDRKVELRLDEGHASQSITHSAGLMVLVLGPCFFSTFEFKLKYCFLLCFKPTSTQTRTVVLKLPNATTL